MLECYTFIRSLYDFLWFSYSPPLFLLLSAKETTNPSWLRHQFKLEAKNKQTKNNQTKQQRTKINKTKQTKQAAKMFA